MSAQSIAPIIIKRKKVVAGGGHHGGAWKVAIWRSPVIAAVIRLQVSETSFGRRCLSDAAVGSEEIRATIQVPDQHDVQDPKKSLKGNPIWSGSSLEFS